MNGGEHGEQQRRRRHPDSNDHGCHTPNGGTTTFYGTFERSSVTPDDLCVVSLGPQSPGCTSSVGEAQGAEVICSSVTARSQPHRFSNPPCPSSHNISEWTELGKTSAPVTPKHFTKEANKAQRWKGSLIASTSLWQVAGVRVSEGTDCCFVPVISSKWNSLRGGGGYGINNSDQGGSWKRGFCSSLSEAFPGVIWGTARGSLLYPVAGLLSFGCSWGWFSNRGQTSHPKVPSLTLDFAFPPVKGPLLP